MLPPKMGGWMRTGLSKATNPQPLGRPWLVFLNTHYVQGLLYNCSPGSLESLSGFGFLLGDPESTLGCWTSGVSLGGDCGLHPKTDAQTRVSSGLWSAGRTPKGPSEAP